MARLWARTVRPLPWRVMRQRGTSAHEVCRHRFERIAVRCSNRRQRTAEIGVWYESFRAVDHG